MVGTAARLLPIYLVIDVSASMSAHGKLDAANAIVPAVVDALSRNPALAGRIRFGLIDFAGTASVRLPLCDLLALGVVPPRLSLRDGADVAAALDAVRRELAADLARLEGDGFAVHRPAVWLVGAGEPADDPAARAAAFARLVRSPAGPDVIACAVGHDPPEALAALVHPPCGPGRTALYLTEPDRAPADAVTAVAEVLISSMIQSGYSLGLGGAATTLPDPADLPAGIHQLDTGTWTER